MTNQARHNSVITAPNMKMADEFWSTRTCHRQICEMRFMIENDIREILPMANCVSIEPWTGYYLWKILFD